MAHPRTKLTVFGRQLLVLRVETLGWPVAHAAAMQGISRATGYKWVRRYRAEGQTGLFDRSSRPRRSPRALSPDQVQAILAARIDRRWGPHRLAPLTGRPRSTVYATLRRAGLSRLQDADRKDWIPIRYEACHPGALLHQDHKKLGRVPDGGGHRIRGRTAATHSHGVGYDHFEVVIDDRSRVGFVIPVPDERPASAVLALELAAAEFARLGVRIERVLTDNGGPYRSRAYAAAMTARRPPQADPAIPPADQRQGRALHQDAPRRVGLCPALSVKRRAPGSSRGLGRLLQSRAHPHRSCRPRPDGRSCQQRPWGISCARSWISGQ